MECRFCGEENESGATVCGGCGAKLTKSNEKASVVPKMEKKASKDAKGTVTLVLKDIFSNSTYEIAQDGVIARERGDIYPEVFSKNDYISDPHCRLHLINNQWMIEDLDSTNKTKVNGVELTPFTETALYAGSHLKLANMDFKVDFICEKACQVEDETADANQEMENQTCEKGTSCKNEQANDNTREEKTVWEITCPCCGKVYEVENANAVIQNCNNCEDDFDRIEIQYEKPKMRKKYAD